MQTYSDTARHGGIRSAFIRGANWLDQRGKWAWITLMILLFVIAWPLGLILLAYLIWEKKMFSRSCGQARHRDHSHYDSASQDTGNTAFDNYKSEALRRLEEEQAAFEAFLQRLRNSKDKSEFDAFMEDRARSTAAADVADQDGTKDLAVQPADGARPGEY